MPATQRSPQNGAQPPSARSIDRLLRELVAVSPEPESSCSGDQVLLERTVGGVQYVLIRRPSAEPIDHSLLSPRELEISRLVAKGFVNKTIAGVLEISYYTVDTYLRRIFAKLNVTSRAAMVARLSEEGYLNDPIPPA